MCPKSRHLKHLVALIGLGLGLFVGERLFEELGLFVMLGEIEPWA